MILFYKSNQIVFLYFTIQIVYTLTLKIVMMYFTLVYFIVFLTCVSQTMPNFVNVKRAYESLIQEFGHVYPNSAEKEYRFQIFSENLKSI